MSQILRENKRIIVDITLFLILFYVIFAFFAFVTPLVPYDGDDWSYLSAYRNPWPKWGAWNPTRVFPEVFMPAIGDVAAYVVYPFIHDYILSVTIASSMTLAIFFTFLVYELKKTYKYFLKTTDDIVWLLCLLFVILHFVMFKSGVNNNVYLLHSVNLTTVFYYVIPNLLNSAIVLWLLRQKDIDVTFKMYSTLKKGLFVVAVYFALFSNVFCSEILGTFVLVSLFMNSYAEQNHKSVKQIVRDTVCHNKVLTIIFTIWAVAILMEPFGGRAKQLGAKKLDIFAACQHFQHLLYQLNHPFVYVSLGLIIFSIVFYWKFRKSISQEKDFYDGQKRLLISFIAMLIMSIMATAKSVPGYASNPDSMYGVFFLAIVILSLCLGYLLKKIDKLHVFIPLLMLILCACCMKGINVKSSIMGNIAPRDAISVSQYLVNQVVEAANERQEKMTLYVPKGDNHDNWPHPMYMGGNISRTLYKHGLIDYPIKIEIQPDASLNEQYHLPIQK